MHLINKMCSITFYETSFKPLSERLLNFNQCFADL